MKSHQNNKEKNRESVLPIYNTEEWNKKFESCVEKVENFINASKLEDQPDVPKLSKEERVEREKLRGEFEWASNSIQDMVNDLKSQGLLNSEEEEEEEEELETSDDDKVVVYKIQTLLETSEGGKAQDEVLPSGDGGGDTKDDSVE